VGNPSPGSASVTLGFNATVQSANVSYNPPSPLNMTGKNPTLWVRLDSGSARAKLFIKTTGSWVWGNGPEVALTVGNWTQLTLNANSPAFNNSGYDPSDVRQVGVELFTDTTATPSNVHLDTWAY
jgi:hypothetical protein